MAKLPHPAISNFSSSSLASPSAAVLALLAAIANSSCADARPTPPPPAFLCPSILPRTPSTPTAYRRKRQSRNKTLSVRDVPDRYELFPDGKWHKIAFTTQSLVCPQCQPDPLASSTGTPGINDVAHNDVITGDAMVSPTLRFPPGWGDKPRGSKLYQVPIIVLSSVILAGIIATLIVGAVVWRRRKRQSADLEKKARRKKRSPSSDAHPDELEELDKRLRGQKVWAKASARWKANARWVYRRGRGKRQSVALSSLRRPASPLQAPSEASSARVSISSTCSGNQNTRDMPEPAPLVDPVTVTVDDPPTHPPAPATPPPPLSATEAAVYRAMYHTLPHPLALQDAAAPTDAAADTRASLPPAYRRRTALPTREPHTGPPGASTLTSPVSHDGADRGLGHEQASMNDVRPADRDQKRRADPAYEDGSGGPDECGGGDVFNDMYEVTTGEVAAHVATDDKRVLARLADLASRPPPMLSSPSEPSQLETGGIHGDVHLEVSAPEWREDEFDDVGFGDGAACSTSSQQSAQSMSLLPPPPPPAPSSLLLPLPSLAHSTSLTSLSLSYYSTGSASPYATSYTVEEEEIAGTEPELGPSAPPFEYDGGVASAPPEFDDAAHEEEPQASAAMEGGEGT